MNQPGLFLPTLLFQGGRELKSVIVGDGVWSPGHNPDSPVRRV